MSDMEKFLDRADAEDAGIADDDEDDAEADDDEEDDEEDLEVDCSQNIENLNILFLLGFDQGNYCQHLMF
jgi:hypothetical protein